MSQRDLGPRGAALIKAKEQLRLEAYMPTPNDVPTIGWGRTKGVKMGDTITAEQAERFFQEDTAEAVEAVRNLGVVLSQSQFDALVVFAFNCGVNSISVNTGIGRTLRKRDWFGAFREWARWTKQAGVDLRGLAIRRAQEMQLFFEDKLP